MTTRLIALAGLVPALLLTSLVHAAPAQDPWQSWNRKVHAFNKKVDGWFFKPVAQGYRQVTPQWADDAVTRFFMNLEEPLNLINNGLQGKGKAAARDLGRLTVNTVTSLGFADVAGKMGWARSNEDFGQTLGVWGVPAGPYLVLPFLGPSDLRDAASIPVDSLAKPANYLHPESHAMGLFVLEKVDFRADLIPLEKILEGDEYLYFRDIYLQRRDYLVHDGKVRDEFLDDDTGTTGDEP